MAGARAEAYATAVAEIARAEGQLDTVADQLYQLANAVETDDDLRTTLQDRSIPAVRRTGVVHDLLGGRASPVTENLINMIVAGDRGGDLPEIADAVRHNAAAARSRTMAVVRSAYPLDGDQRERLEEALGRATGKTVDVQVVVDPTVKGGVVAQVDDLVFDGSVAHKLDNLRSAL